MTQGEPLHPLYPHVPYKPSYHIREAARYLGWSRWSFHQAIDRGELQVIRPVKGGRGLKIPGVELRSWIERSIFDSNA